MISIKKWLATDDREAAAAFERMARLLLQAIALHAVAGERNDSADFHSAIAGVQTSLEHDSSAQNILVAAGTAIEALQIYNRRTSLCLQGKTNELQSMLAMLTQAMSQIVALSEGSVARLHDLQERIEHAVQIEDVRLLKERLSDCLESIRVEVARQRDEAGQLVSGLKQALQETQERHSRDTPSGDSGPGDPLTGLPVKADAKLAIAAACGPGSHVYAGMFVVDRIQSIQTRYGSRTADQALLCFLQYLSQALAPADKFFRWDDLSFLVLIERREPADLVRGELSKAIARRSEHTFHVNGRAVVLQLSSTWTVLPLCEHTSAEIVRKLEAFCGSLGRT